MAARVKLFGKLLSAAYLLGIMPKEEYLQPGSGLIRTAYGAYQLFPVLTFIPILLSQIAALYRYWGDTILVLDIIGLMDGVTIGFLVNVWGFFACRKFCKLLEYLETEAVFTSPLVQQNAKLRDLFEKGQRKCIFLSRGIACSICFAISFLGIAPIVIRYLQLEGEICQNIVNRSLTPRELYHQDGYDQFSIPMWLPVDSTRWYYEIWFLQVVALGGAMRAMAPYSSMMIGMFVATGLQFELIAALIEQINDFPDHEKVHNVLETVVLRNKKEEGFEDKTAKNYLKVVIRLHQQALASSEEMDSLQKPIVGGCLVLTVIIISTSMFQMTIDPTLSLKYAMVLGGCLFHVFVYSFVGEYIYEQSERIGKAAFEINWYERSTEFKRLIHIIMIRCQKPCVWSLLELIDIKLVAFVDITSACYRVLMILLQFEEALSLESDCPI